MIYNLFLFLYAMIMAPKILWQMARKSKRLPTFKDRLGYPNPTAPNGTRIWIHAVSLGEMKAAAALIRHLSHTSVLITTSTATGFEEATRSFLAAQIRYLPLDFSWTMRRWMRSFNPNLLVFVEGDIWPNLLHEAQMIHAKTALISGRISERSVKRFRFFPKLARRLFSLDLIAVQNEENRKRFLSLVDREIVVGGNLKLDIQPAQVDVTAIRRRFSLSNQNVVTLACTHASEEKELLELLRPLLDKIVLFLAPRHPERFEEVASLLHQMNIPFCRWNQSRNQEPVILVDAMGHLPNCYSMSHAAILAGSFSSKKGGHNVMEPCLYHCPVLYGPHMFAQQELAQMVEKAGAGRPVTHETLVPTLLEFLSSDAFRTQTHDLVEKNHGSAVRMAAMILDLSKKI
jgi:3-deoxy-D-manno-octulosonic-acid transferase